MSKVSQIGPYTIIQNTGAETEAEQVAGFTQFIFKSMLRVLKLKGVPVDVDGLVTVYFLAERDAIRIHQDQKARGVKPEIRELLAATKKRDAEKIAKRLVITLDELVSLKANAKDLGYRYRFFAKEFLPPGLQSLKAPDQLSNPDRTLTKEGVRWTRDISRVFSQRKQQFVHLFENDDEFHFFFFDASDIKGAHGNHGEHLHYSSHLWDIPREDTFRDFEIKGRRPTSVHITFIDTKRDGVDGF